MAAVMVTGAFLALRWSTRKATVGKGDNVKLDLCLVIFFYEERKREEEEKDKPEKG